MSVSVSAEQTHEQPSSLKDLHDRLAVLQTKPVWARWLHAGLMYKPATREWTNGRVAAINELMSEQPFQDDDIRVVANNGVGIPQHVWSTQDLYPNRDRLRQIGSSDKPLKEAHVVGSATLDLGNQRLLAVLNLVEVGQHDIPVYALPITDLAYLIQHEAADIVQQPPIRS